MPNHKKKCKKLLEYKNLVLIVATLCIGLAAVQSQEIASLDNELMSGEQFHYTKADMTEVLGGSIMEVRTLRTSESPYIVRTDLVVERNGQLIIEPGVQVFFAPMVGITVRGTFKAVVSIKQIYFLLQDC